MGMADTLMMVGVLAVGGYVVLKVLPQLKLGQAQAAPVPVVTPVTPVAPAQPACGVQSCDDQGDDVSCQCTGQAAFAMGQSRTCEDCTEVCKQRCAGQGNFVPDSPDDDDDDNDNDDDDDDDDNGGGGGGGFSSPNRSADLKKKINQCAGLTGQTYKSCVGSYARKVSYARRSYQSLLTAQTLNRIRRARLAQAYYNMNYDPSRII